MDHEHSRKPLAFDRPREIPLYRTVAVRRLNALVANLQVLIVGLYSLCPRIVRREALKYRRDCQSANRKLRHMIEKRSAVYVAVLIFMKKVQ